MAEYSSAYTDYEINSRVRNMAWTVSGDYELKVDVDRELYKRSPYAAMYEAVKQGAMDKYFDVDRLNGYLIRKMYLGGDIRSLTMIAGVCTDTAAFSQMREERAGVYQLRRKAFSDYMDIFGGELLESFEGKLTAGVMNLYLTGRKSRDRALESAVFRVADLEEAESTDDIIETIDEIYNTWGPGSASAQRAELSEVLEVTDEELSEWEPSEDILNELLGSEKSRGGHNIGDILARPNLSSGKSENRGREIFGDGYDSDEKIKNYIRQVFGESILTPQENEVLNRRLCTGVHTDCAIHMTDGLLNGIQENSAYYKYAEMFKNRNMEVFRQNKSQVRKNVSELTELLRKSLRRRSEPEWSRKSSGRIIPRELWKAERTNETRLFSREDKRDNSAFAVDILIDGSGSQSARQSQIALQGFIISEALSNVGIPFRVMSFCSFWEYTILHVFRDYDDKRTKNGNIFEYRGKANNRDGLAVRAAADGLLMRPEENRLMIVLSDGRPNAFSKGTEDSKNPANYQGDVAVRDTAFEIRRARERGISIMGIFTGLEEDLEAEHKIFGNSFAYTKNIENFSRLAGRYLKMQLDADE